MKKILLAVLVLVGLAVGGLVLFGLDPIVKHLQPTLLNIAAKHLNQPVSADSIHVSVFPDITIDLTDLTIGAPAAPTGSVKKIKLKTSIGKLLSTPIGVSGITVDGAAITVTRRKDGSIALGDFVVSSPKPKGSPDNSSSGGLPGAPKVAPEVTAPASNSEIAFNLTEGALENSKVTIVDQSVVPAQATSISDINFTISDFGAGDSPFKFDASLFGRKNVSSSGTINMGKVTNGIPTVVGKLGLNSIDLDQALKTAAAYGVKIPAELKNTLALDTSFSTAGGNWSGSLSLDLTAAGISFPPHIQKAAAIPLKADLVVSVVPPSSIQSGSIDLTIDNSKLTAKLSPASSDGSGTLSVTSPGIDLGGLKRICGDAEQYGLGGSVKLNLTVPNFSAANAGVPSAINGTVEFNNVSAQVPLGGSSEGENSKKQIVPIDGINGEIQMNGSKITAKGLSIKVAQQVIELGASLAGLPTPDSAFVMKSEKLELEPLARAAMAEPPPALNGAVINGLNLTGTYSTGKKTGATDLTFSGGTVAGLPLGAAKISAALSPGLTELKPSELLIFGGNAKFSGIMRGEAQKSLDFGLTGSGFDLEPITKFGKPDRSVYLTGAVATLNTSIQAANTAEFATSMHAAITVTTGKGSLEGINIIASTLGKIGQIPGLNWTIESLIPEKSRFILQGNSTAFDSLSSNVSIVGPNTTIRSAELVHTLYLITGSGTLSGGDFDLDLQLRLTPELTSDMLAREAHLKLLLDPAGNMQIPVRITRRNGTTLIYPDVSRLAKSAATNTVKEAAGRVLDKVAPGLGGAKGVLDQLFK